MGMAIKIIKIKIIKLKIICPYSVLAFALSELSCNK
jgi:hypothetical protein